MQASTESRSWPRAFAPGGVEILANRFTDHGEVTLWSVAGTAPGRGELFTIEHDQAIHDLSVIEVRGHSPGWSALCRRVEIAWS